MKWNWQQENWPEFRFDLSRTEALEREFLLRAGSALGVIAHLGDGDRDQVRVQLLSEEALHSSRIEGEILDRDSLQSSIQHQLGLQGDRRKVRPAERGIVELLIDGYRHFRKPLDAARLCQWHTMLMQSRRDLEVGRFRSGGDPMRIVLGPIHDPKVHYEAPPAARVPAEIQSFFRWWNGAGKELPCLARAALAHLHFESIHPFEDGNGRIGRALSELAVCQSLDQPVILALSSVIDANRSTYYDELARASRGLNVDRWIEYFSRTIGQAQELSLKSVEFLVAKSRFFDRHLATLHPRQEKVLVRMFREGWQGFQGGLSAANYRAIAKTSTATATRDLARLVEIGALLRTGDFKHARYHLNVAP